MPKPPRQLDSRIEIVTPENIAFHYVLAGPFRRLPAYLIDCAIRLLVLVALLVGVMAWGAVGAAEIGLGVTFIAWFVMSWFYGGLFESLWNGQTPGKRILRLRVLSVDGRPINAAQAVLRNVLRDVDAMPMIGWAVEAAIPLYTLGLAVMAVSDRFQRLGDLACRTIVVVEERPAQRELATVGDEEVVRFASALPSSLVVRRSLTRALSVYVSRRRLFSPARRFEIARTLAAPLAEQWGLSAQVDPDLLLRALYYRAFVTDRPEAEPDRRAAALLEVGQS